MEKINPWAIALALALSISFKVKYDEAGLVLEITKLKTELAENQGFNVASICDKDLNEKD
jgi:hypothetical protein